MPSSFVIRETGTAFAVVQRFADVAATVGTARAVQRSVLPQPSLPVDPLQDLFRANILPP